MALAAGPSSGAALGEGGVPVTAVFVAGVIIGIAVGFVGFAWITAPERRRAAVRLQRQTMRADLAVSLAEDAERRATDNGYCALAWEQQAIHFRGQYDEKVREVGVYLSMFGGDTPEAVAAEVTVEARHAQ